MSNAKKWYCIRRDFVRTGEARCHFCNRPLTSETAYFLVPHDDRSVSNEVYSGKTCFERNAINGHSRVPDLTKSITATKVKKAVLTSLNRTDRDSKKHIVHEYLYLRGALLPKQGFKDVYYPMLYALYKKIEGGEELKSVEVNKVFKIVGQFSNSYNALSLEHLKTCYAIDYWLKVMLESDPGNEFCLSLIKQLHNKKYLTVKQLDSLNDYILKRHSKLVPSIDRTLFANVEKTQREFLKDKMTSKDRETDE